MSNRKHNPFDIISGISWMITAFLFILQSTGSIHLKGWVVFIPVFVASGIILFIMFFSVLVFKLIGKPHENKT